jgi:hypothetical protein
MKSLDSQHGLLYQALERIPGVEEAFKQKAIRIDDMMGNIVAAKNAADPISRRITRLRDQATTGTRHATLQKEYANALIEMCAIGCVDARRARIIEQMLREVSSYPAVMESESPDNKLKEVSEECRRTIFDHERW